MVKYEKVIGILALIIIGGLLTGRVYSANIKIGTIDVQKAVNECNAGKEAKKALARDVEKFQALIPQKQKELQEMKESLERQGHFSEFIYQNIGCNLLGKWGRKWS